MSRIAISSTAATITTTTVRERDRPAAWFGVCTLVSKIYAPARCPG